MQSTTKQAWDILRQDLSGLQTVKDKTDALISRINKGHLKVQNREESQESFTVKAGNRLQEIYSNYISQTEQERMSQLLIRAIENVLVNLDNLIEMQESMEQEEGFKKRKSDSLSEQVKRQKLEEQGISFLVGDQVAAKVGNEWILAVITVTDKFNMVEIEDIEEDDENPGLKKKYTVQSRFIIPIIEKQNVKEFSIGHKVLALYPSSSCFYRAVVVLPPSKV